MIYVVHRSLTHGDKLGFLKILSCADIDENDVKFVDLAIDDLDIKTKDFILAINTYKDIARSLIAAKLFDMKQLLGNDVLDPVTKFALINIPHSVQELYSNDNAKQIVWHKLLTFSAFYKECGSVGGYEGNLVINGDQPLAEAIDAAMDEPEEVASEEPKDLKEIGSINMDSIFQALADQLDLTDPSLGKSLALSDRIQFETDDVKICIYPNNRMSAKDQSEHDLNLSYKDMIAILKLGTMFDAKKISFFKIKE